MKKFYTSIILALLVITSVGFAQTPPDSYKAKVKELMVLNGTENIFKQTIKQMIEQFKKTEKSVPPEFWNDFEKEFMETSLDDLVDVFSPIYFKHLTEDDLNKLIEFLNTPAGKKFSEKTPIISQESYKVGQEWGKNVANRIIEKIQSIAPKDTTKK